MTSDRSDSSLPPSYFDDMYEKNHDPWEFRSRWYEERKRALTLAALPKPSYRNAFEPGCSIGVLTEALATRCNRVLATDVADSALASARTRLADTSSVELRKWALGDIWPDERFDLIVISEVGYYLDTAALRTACDDAVDHAEFGATVVFVHWRHPVVDYPMTGDEVHAVAHSTGGLAPLARYSDEDVLIDVFIVGHGTPTSVARAGGLV